MKTQEQLDSEIQLGMEVEDLSSGLKGIVDAKQYHLHSGMKVSVQPKGDGSELKTGWVLDAISVKVINETPIVPVTVPEPKIELGKRAKCSVTEFEGVVVARSLHINGCVRIKLLEKHRSDKVTIQLEPQAYWIDEPAAVVIEPKKADPKPTPKKNSTGGPAQSRGDQRGFLNKFLGKGL